MVAGQIGKVVRQLKNPRNVILSLGSRWFGRWRFNGRRRFREANVCIGKYQEIVRVDRVDVKSVGIDLVGIDWVEATWKFRIRY